MWVLGHGIAAYFLVKGGCWIFRRECRPQICFLAIVFGNLIDASHFGPLRSLLHNPWGTAALMALVGWFLMTSTKISRFEVGMLELAILSHVGTDLLFSSYQPAWPFDPAHVTVFGFNSPEHIITANILGVCFLAWFFLSGDAKNVRAFFTGLGVNSLRAACEIVQKATQISPSQAKTHAISPNSLKMPNELTNNAGDLKAALYLLAYWVFFWFSAIQLAGYIGYFALFINARLWFHWVFLGAFTAFLLAFWTCRPTSSGTRTSPPHQAGESSSSGSRPSAAAPLSLVAVTAELAPVAKNIILQGLKEHWGEIQEGLNPDLDDLYAYYSMPKRTFFLGYLDGNPIQYVCTGGLVPETETAAQIVRMYVKAPYRRLGYAGQLLAALENVARQDGYATIVLETTDTWLEAIAFYSAQGYQTVGRFDGDVHFEKVISF